MMTLAVPSALLRLTLVVAAVLLLAPPVHSASGATGDLPPEPVSRTVEIDGRVITVQVSLLRVIPGNIPEGWPGPATRVQVQLSVNDGALLPDGLRATRVRFEKLRGVNRIFRASLTEIDTFPSGSELDARLYNADISDQARSVRRLKTTVRLELDGRVILVPMGNLPINLAGITQ